MSSIYRISSNYAITVLFSSINNNSLLFSHFFTNNVTYFSPNNFRGKTTREKLSKKKDSKDLSLSFRESTLIYKKEGNLWCGGQEPLFNPREILSYEVAK